MKMDPRPMAVVELVIAAAIWGFAFVATLWALKAFDFWTLTGMRFTAAGLLSLMVVRLRGHRVRTWVPVARMAAAPGLFLGLTIVLQTLGLHYTTATNSGFITVLYVLFVPIIEVLAFQQYPHRLHWLWVGLSIVGAVLICQLQTLTLNIGDLLTLACAVAAAAQIVLVGRSAKKADPMVYNAFQALWAGGPALLISAVIAFNERGQAPPAISQSAWHLALASLLFLTVFSSFIAFFIQVRAQRVLSSGTASMIFLLESPFAAISAYFLLHERLTPLQWTGALILLLAAFAAVQTEARLTKR